MNNGVHRHVQEVMLNKLIFLFGVFTLPVLCVSLIRFFSIGWKPVFSVHIAASTFFLLIAISRKSILYHVKVTAVIALFFVLAISSALNLGMSGFLVGFLMLCVFLAIVFGGKKPAFVVYLCAAVIIFVIGILNVKGIIIPKTDIETYRTFFSSWVTTLIGFTFITGISTLIVGEIGHLLASKIEELNRVNHELQKANDEIKILSGMLPICSYCKKVKDDKGYWNQIEEYISSHSEAIFSHSICNTCAKKYYSDFDLYEDSEE
ncbi:MAG: hypothetical protein MI892_26525 [Desulfobacterales bacterium]|nr:hypothetical protein [Desulfobacterales bacterium]